MDAAQLKRMAETLRNEHQLCLQHALRLEGKLQLIQQILEEMDTDAETETRAG